MDKEKFYEFIIENKNINNNVEGKINIFCESNNNLRNLLYHYILKQKMEWDNIISYSNAVEGYNEHILYKELLFIDSLKRYYEINPHYLRDQRNGFNRNNIPREIEKLIELGESIFTADSKVLYAGIYLANLHALLGNIERANIIYDILEEAYSSNKTICEALDSSKQIILFSFYSWEDFLNSVNKKNIIERIFYKYLFLTNPHIRSESFINLFVMTALFFWKPNFAFLWLIIFSVVNISGYIIGAKTNNGFIKKSFRKKEFLLIATLTCSFLINLLFIV